MIVRRKVGPRGQIVIPKIIREYLRIEPGSVVEMEVREGVLLIRPVLKPEEFIEEFCSVSNRKLKGKVDVKGILEEEVEGRYALR